MTTPTLGLGITAAGRSEVEALAAAVAQLKNNLVDLKNTATGGQFSNLDALTKEITGMRGDLQTALAGIRTELADGFSKMNKEVQAGGEATASSLQKVNVRLRAESVDLGGGVSALLSAKGLEMGNALRGVAAQIASNGDAVAAAMEANTLAQIKAEEKQKLAWVVYNNDLREQAAAAQAQDEKRIQGYKLVSAQWETARLERIAQEKAAADAQAAATALASAKIEAAYLAASARQQVARQISARAQLDQGIDAAAVEQQFGRMAASAAAAAPSLTALQATVNSLTTSVHGNSGAIQLNQRFWREAGTEINEVVQGRWNRAIGTISSMANALGLFQFVFSGVGAAIALGAVTIGTFVAAVIKGEQETSSFNKAIILTGGYVGLAKGQFDEMAHSIASGLNVGIGTAKEALLDMAKTGRITGTALQVLTEDAVLMSQVTGEKLDAIAKDYARMPDGVFKWAEEHNKSMHFMSTAQLEHIRLLELQGDKQKAMTEVGEHLRDALRAQTENLGTLEKALKSTSNAWSTFWDAAKGVGREQTVQEKLADLEAAITRMKGTQDPNAKGLAAVASTSGGYVNSELLAMEDQAASLRKEIFRIAERTAASTAELVRQEKDSTGTQFLQTLGLKIDKAAKVDEVTRQMLVAVQQHNDNFKGDKSESFSLLTGQGFIGSDQVSKWKVEIEQKYNHAAATEAQRLATMAYGDELKRLSQTLADYSQTEKIDAEDERHQAAVLKAQYDSGALTFGDYQSKLTDIQNAGAAKRMQLMVQEEAAISAQLDTLNVKAAGLKSGTAQAVIDKVANDQANVAKQLEDQKQKIVVATNKEYERQLDLQAKALAPAKTMLDNADKELDKLKVGMALDMQKLDLKTNINQLSERDQFIQEKVLASTKSTTDALFNAQELVKKLSSEGGIWAGLTAQDFEDGSPAAKDLAKMLDYIERLKAALADMKPKLTAAFSADFDAAKIQATAKEVDNALTNAILNAGKNGGATFRKELEDALLLKPFKILLQGVLGPLSQDIAKTAYSLFGGATSGGAGGLVGDVATGASLANSANGLSSGTGLFGGLGTTISNGYASLTGQSVIAGGPITMPGAVGVAAGAADTSVMGAAAASDVGSLGASTVAGTTAAESGLAAIPVYGWIALAAIAAYEVFFTHHGGPKEDGSAGTVLSDIGKSGHDQDPAAQTALDALTGQYTTLLSALGGTDNGIKFGVGISSDPRGKAPTFLDVSASNSDGSALTDITNQNVGRSQQELQDAITLQASQAVLTALQASDLPTHISDYLKTFDPLKQTTAQVTAITTAATQAQALYTAFGKLGPAFQDVTDMSVLDISKFIALMGGLQKASAELSDYYDKFYSDAQKRQNLVRDITKTLTDAGLTVSETQISTATRAQFRAVADSLDKTTVEGQKAFAALMSVEGAFATLTDTTNKFTDYTTNFFTAAEQRTATINSIVQTLTDAGLTVTASQVATATREQFRQIADSLDTTTEAGMSAFNAMMSVAGAFASITDASSLAQTALDKVNAAREQVISAYQAEATALKTFVTDVTKFLTDLAVGNLSPLTPAQKYLAASNTFQSTLTAANAGDATAQADLTKAAQDFLTASQAYNASSPQYQTDFQAVQQALKSAVTTAAATSATMDDQLKSLGVINTSVVSVKDAIANLAVAVQAAIAAGKGGSISQSVLDVVGATVPTSPTTSGGSTSTTTPTSNVITSAAGATFSNGNVTILNGMTYTVEQIRGYIQTLQPMEAYNTFKGAGISLADADRIMQWSAGSAEQWAISQGLPVFGAGINFVPKSGLAMIHEGERILPAADNRVLMHKLSSSNADGVREEIRVLRSELVAAVKALHADNNTGHTINAQQTAQSAAQITGKIEVIASKNATADKAQDRARLK